MADEIELLGDPGDELVQLGDAAVGYAKASRARATWAAYDAAWSAFLSWAIDKDCSALPADPYRVADYLAELAEAGAAVSTISLRAASISVVHQTSGLDSPCRTEVVRRVLAGIRRSGAKPKQATAITLSDLHRMVAVCDPDTMIGVRNRALLLVGFAGGFRRSELVAVDVHHLEAVEAGIRLYVPSSKTDQAGRGDTKALPYGSDPSTCPVTAVRTWLERSGIVEGPVFRRVLRGGAVGPDRLSDRSVARLVDALASEAGLAPGRWSGHSLRSGFVTVAAARGASERSIARQTGHAPGSAVLRTYIRHASVFTDNAVTDLGL